MYQHWKDQVAILQEVISPLPQCPIWGMHMHMARFSRHHRTYRCSRVIEMRLRRFDVEISQRSGEMKFKLNDREYDPLIEGLTQFKYLGVIL